MSFIKRRDDVTVVTAPAFGGNGAVENHKILNGPEDMFGKGRLFNHGILNPGCEVGWHIHHGDCETYYILKGRGEYSDNGTIVEVGPGDVTFVGDGEGHAMRCISDEPLEMIALILYTD